MRGAVVGIQILIVPPTLTVIRHGSGLAAYLHGTNHCVRIMV